MQAVVKCAILSTTVISHQWRTVMGSPTLEKVRSEALNLSESERAELAQLSSGDQHCRDYFATFGHQYVVGAAGGAGIHHFEADAGCR